MCVQASAVSCMVSVFFRKYTYSPSLSSTITYTPTHTLPFPLFPCRTDPIFFDRAGQGRRWDGVELRGEGREGGRMITTLSTALVLSPANFFHGGIGHGHGGTVTTLPA